MGKIMKGKKGVKGLVVEEMIRGRREVRGLEVEEMIRGRSNNRFCAGRKKYTGEMKRMTCSRGIVLLPGIKLQ